MATEIKVPELGESITEGVIARWLVGQGDAVGADAPVVEVETDKITVEIPAPTAGVLITATAAEGDTVNVGDVIGTIDGSAAPKPASAAEPAATPPDSESSGTHAAPPSARAEARRSGVDLDSVQGTGPHGRIQKEDVVRAAAKKTAGAAAAPSAKASRPARAEGIREERKPMTPLRKRVAERLVQAQTEAALLTTFNEVDMSAVMTLRARYKASFLDRHGVKLGFMSFFVKAAVDALKAFPSVNAEIDGTDVVFKYDYNVGVAVGGGKGLVVPVVRDADAKTFAEIEREIGELGRRARDNKITLEDLSGGTFTISNGGVYGSMLSTPIINPPQTGILGLHNIVERPVAIDGEVVIRPVMYLALSYDHRLVDGREAVSFLVRIKELIEDPERLLLEV